jgi:predicted nucleotidyltransferase
MSEKQLTENDRQRLIHCLSRNSNILAAWHFGSSAHGGIRPGADVDIGVLFHQKPTIDELVDLRAVIQDAVSFDEIDLVVLNDASPVLRFEAVSGRPVYTADPEARATFCSLTAREYEDEMAQWQWALNLKS